MATNFFSRWSQRKLDESTDESQETEQTLEKTESSSEISSGQSNASSKIEQVDTEASTETTLSSAGAEEATDVQGLAPEEDVSVAQLLVSEASESVKKAALRKLFLSEEFNVRDGLDDYDDDYSNLKSLSEGVAETLRDWVKDKTEEETTLEEEQVIDNKGEGDVLEGTESDLEVSDNELETSESAEIAEEEKELYKNTVPDIGAAISDEADLKKMGQNIPHKE
ncbi:DUF3306 domain-containing protein [Vibrio cyclitrophicus]|uniref:DUF3306 domain-containing protein n=1 Tax=Vibrio cyclitrophicus TaxID=47951 RepID=UPI000C82E08D|nr:DUF3306 domain-containing protein [Vibrio cyclitrophicus]NOH18655.1 DUF3306 domain-containing protein [Vibrio cyclitrophicus]PMF24992.1 hypothetical protein BCV18_14860 [Vibrio cyclitrophicus]